MKHRVPRAESVERESDESRSQRKQSGSDAAAQLHQSPRQLKQEQRVNAVFGEAVQREADDEELLQGKFDTAQRMDGVEDEDVMQGKLAPAQQQTMEMEDELPMQGKFSSSGPAQLQAEPSAENLTGMPDQLKAGIESLSGMDMSAVRVHRNSDKPAQLSALAYAQGNDIHLGPGQEQHLPHEAWHVVQQRQGRVQATMQMQGVAVNDDVGLEREADAKGAQAINATPASRPAAEPVQRVRGSLRAGLPKKSQPGTPEKQQSEAQLALNAYAKYRKDFFKQNEVTVAHVKQYKLEGNSLHGHGSGKEGSGESQATTEDANAFIGWWRKKYG